jgi:hypothetical protein
VHLRVPGFEELPIPLLAENGLVSLAACVDPAGLAIEIVELGQPFPRPELGEVVHK